MFSYKYLSNQFSPRVSILLGYDGDDYIFYDDYSSQYFILLSIEF